MKTPQWLVDFYRKWWAAVTPPDPNAPTTNPYYVAEEIPRYVPQAYRGAILDEQAERIKNLVPTPPGYDLWLAQQAPKPKPRKRQPIKARKALKKAKAKKHK